MISQYYLMECIIISFPYDYNRKSMSLIPDSWTKLFPTLYIKSLFINLNDKLSKIIREYRGIE